MGWDHLEIFTLSRASEEQRVCVPFNNADFVRALVHGPDRVIAIRTNGDILHARLDTHDAENLYFLHARVLYAATEEVETLGGEAWEKEDIVKVTMEKGASGEIWGRVSSEKSLGKAGEVTRRAALRGWFEL